MVATHAVDLTLDVTGYTRAPATTYGYDSTGQRTTIRRSDGTTTTFGWDRSSLPVLLTQHDGSTTTAIVHGPGGPLKQIGPDGTALWYHQDHLGSTRLTTNATGAEHARYDYSAYGEPTTDTTPAGAARPLLTYNGQYRDPGTGLYYLHARHYDPATGQFTSRDPLTHATEQPYSYARPAKPSSSSIWRARKNPETRAGSRTRMMDGKAERSCRQVAPTATRSPIRSGTST